MKVLKDLNLLSMELKSRLRETSGYLSRWFRGEDLNPPKKEDLLAITKAQLFVEERVIKDYYDSDYFDFYYYWADYYKHWEDICETVGVDFYLVASNQRLQTMVELSRPQEF